MGHAALVIGRDVPCGTHPAKAFPMKVIMIFAGVALVLAVLALGVHALRRNAGVPSLDDPKQVTPPPARDMSQNERHGEHL